MLTRISTGISLQSNQDHQQPVLTSSNSGYHLLVPFFGGEDDYFAVSLALQIAYNEDVTVTILLVTEPSSSASGSQNAVNDATFFHATKSNLPATLVTRVVFEESVGQAAEVLKSAISSLDRAFSTGDKPEQILLHGLSGFRDTTSWSYDQPSAGVLSATVLNVLQEAEFETSLLVVQAKKEGELGGSGILKGK
jgi:hypothetical protein